MSAAWLGDARAAVVAELRSDETARFDFTVPAPFAQIRFRLDFLAHPISMFPTYQSELFVDGDFVFGTSSGLQIDRPFELDVGTEPGIGGVSGYILFSVSGADLTLTGASLGVAATFGRLLQDVAIDRISVIPAVPLPHTLALIGPALGLLAYLRHRQTVRRA